MIRMALFSLFAFTLSVVSAASSQAATTNARFSYQAAAQAFATGAVPTLETLVANEWMLVGSASHESVPAEGSGYWPDGKLTRDGWPGYFYSLASFATLTDAFGNSILTRTGRYVGAESGKVYSSATLNGAITPEGVVMTAPNTKTSCGGRLVCKMAASGRMLLCSTTWTDPDKACKKTPTGEPSGFTGYVPKAN